ncbi:MAG: SEC-C domain-containing protein [Sandaracinaceae bacterium]|jgi:SEC-C motif-containing protein|nr:SEC-C domain-containing protein [Sandaracinaceae bacterium]
MSAPCPCGRDASYEECCAPFHEGRAEPTNAEILMRSRFSAFVKRKATYLWHTLHKDHDERERDPNVFVAHMKAGLAGLVYKSLDILDTRPPDHEGVARVLFYAVVLHGAKDLSFVEISSFANDGSGWRYLFGMPKGRAEIKTDPRKLTIAAIDA